MVNKREASHDAPQKVYLITGTSRGIGKALAIYYLDKGHIVYGCSRGVATVEHQNYRHFAMQVDDEKQAQLLFQSLRSNENQLDVLINNAGIASMNHFLTTPMKTVENIFRTNFFGSFLFCREASKLMMKNRSGRIVNFSTVAVPLRVEGEAIYAASKAAIVSLTQILARELAEFGITINAIGPTPIDTDLIKSVPSEKIDLLLQSQSIHRKGTIEDVINVIDFFLKPESSFITGQTLYLGGV